MQIIGRAFSVGNVTYEVLIEINSGGFGTVYSAEAQGTSHAPPLVVKVPASHVLSSDEWRRRFEREARILGNISHPNVVRTMGLLSYDDGALMLVQEHIQDAKELQSWTYDSDAELASVALQVLYGLRVTHGASEDTRAIHRDLSPRNVLVTEEGTAKIIDFGLAKEDPRTTTILTVVGQAFGTPGCMAPEQRRDSATVDHRADLYALGRTLASCIQQRHPEYVEINELPPPWQSIIEKLTEYDPADRFPDAEAAIRRILNDFCVDNVLPANPSRHFEEFERWKDVPNEWAAVAHRHLMLPAEGSYEHLGLAYRVTDTLLGNAHFKPDAVFAKLDGDVIEERFGAGRAAFADCDPLGSMIRRWYAFLSPETRLIAFRRLCRVAVSYHRYALMTAIRDVLGEELDGALREKLRMILGEEDPSEAIRRE